MWKVKRMNTARIVVLTIAAGGIAAYPADGSDDALPPNDNIDVVRDGVLGPTTTLT
jgi:hypothetical protein